MDTMCQSESRLVQLPEACLLAVLRGCADDARSLFSAARAHSRLRQTAALAVSSIRAVLHKQQQQADSVQAYLTNHGQHIDSIDLDSSHSRDRPSDPAVSLCQLDHNKLQGLSSLALSKVCLQLQPGEGVAGAVGAGVPLQQLQLEGCKLLDGEEGLAAALALLPDLKHLSLVSNSSSDGVCGFRGFALGRLQQLTHLDLVVGRLQDGHGIRQLHKLTRMQDLRLQWRGQHTIKASMLSGMQHLTRLRVLDHGGGSVLEPGALANHERLQHLELFAYTIAGGSVGLAQLLSHLEPLQQLTYLSLGGSLNSPEVNSPPAAAYSALTASSKLQYINLSSCTLPAGVWQHIFPAGRQLPHLQELVAGYLHDLVDQSLFALAPDGSAIVSCCPGLRVLRMPVVRYTAQLLAPLTGLSGLHELALEATNTPTEFEVVRQLTGLQRLELGDPAGDARLLLQLAQQLKQLTHLQYEHSGHDALPTLWKEVPGSEPVGRQVLRHLTTNSDPAVAEEAAAALAE